MSFHESEIEKYKITYRYFIYLSIAGSISLKRWYCSKLNSLIPREPNDTTPILCTPLSIRRDKAIALTKSRTLNQLALPMDPEESSAKARSALPGVVQPETWRIPRYIF